VGSAPWRDALGLVQSDRGLGQGALSRGIDPRTPAISAASVSTGGPVFKAITSIPRSVPIPSPTEEGVKVESPQRSEENRP